MDSIKYLYSWLHSVRHSKGLEVTKLFKINSAQNPRLENIFIFLPFTSSLWGWKWRSAFQKLLNLFYMKAREEKPTTSALTMHCSPVGKYSLSVLFTVDFSGKFQVFIESKATWHSESHLVVLLYIFFHHHKNWVFLHFMQCFWSKSQHNDKTGVKIS